MTVAAEAKLFGALQIESELEDLVRLVSERKPRVVVEIGTALGGSLWAWCQVCPLDATIISIDLPNGPFGGCYVQPASLINLRRPGQDLKLIRGDSHETRTLIDLERVLDGRPVDFLFIDGDHTYRGVKQDWEMYSPLCTGIAALHDIAEHSAEHPDVEVYKFWAELKAEHMTQEFLSGESWGGIGVVYHL